MSWNAAWFSCTSPGRQRLSQSLSSAGPKICWADTRPALLSRKHLRGSSLKSSQYSTFFFLHLPYFLLNKRLLTKTKCPSLCPDWESSRKEELTGWHNSENTKQFNIQLFRTMSNVKTTTTSVKLTVDSLVEWRRWQSFAWPGCRAEPTHSLAAKSFLKVEKRAKTFLFPTELYTFIYRPFQHLKKKQKTNIPAEEKNQTGEMWWSQCFSVTLQIKGNQTDSI